MGVVDGLLVNKGFIIKSLLTFIEEERHRIVGAGLVKQASCDQYLQGFITKLATDAQNMSNDQIISRLTDLYNSMQDVRLYGDKFFEEEDNRNAKNAPVIEEIVPRVAGENQEYTKIAKFVSDRLEKIAYSLGSSGNHKMAFEVEKVIKNIKVGE